MLLILKEMNIKDIIRYYKYLLFEVRAQTIVDQFLYAIATFVTIVLRNVFPFLREKLLPGHLLIKDMVLTVNRPIRVKYYVPRRTDALFHILPYYEETERRFMISLLKKGDVFIDVGAHIGAYSIPAAYKVGDKGIVIAIEPSPVVMFLIRNVMLNKLRNIIVIPKAISLNSKVELTFNPIHSGGSSIVGFPSKGSISIKVDAEPLDHIVDKTLGNKRIIKILKIDVEGAEIEVLRSAIQTLNQTKYVIVEVRYNTIDQVTKILKEHNFSFINLSFCREKAKIGYPCNLIAYNLKLYKE